jgi:SAM-dependent methyltransferase
VGAQPYSQDYYTKRNQGARRSARAVVPLVLDLVRARSVVDVGCGVGTWLSVFREYGVEDILGVDGEHIDRRLLEIPPDRFRALDLEQPFRLDREFDLVVSLEVAEHLPEARAGAFVESLTRLGPVVVFSAAIPFQGGRRHVNLQWPEYWVQRFAERGYAVIDCLRRKIWDNADVQWWYAQNTLLFVARRHLDETPTLATARARAEPGQLSIVHPKQYLTWIEWCRSEHRGA